MKTIQIKIDTRLADEYQRKYRQAFPRAVRGKVSVERFIAAFLEDRLCEEIEFIETELRDR